MPLSKKDYEAIASIIQFTTITVIPLSESGHKKVIPRNDFVNELCTYFKRDNPRFDTDRFKEAVELKSRKTLLEVFSEDELEEEQIFEGEANDNP